MSVIELDRVSKAFGQGRLEVRAVAEVTLTVEEGEIVVVMGPSGSGKTTLLQLVGALLTPTDGDVRIHGTSLRALGTVGLERLRLTGIGFVFQAFNLLGSLSALDNVSLPARLAGRSRRQSRRHAAELLERLGLGDRLHHTPDELSGGEKQRVAIARALVNDPPLLLADEPTANLDATSGYQALHLLERVADDAGKTVVIVTHDHRITDVADRLLWLEDGRLRDRLADFATAADPVCEMEIVVERAAASRTRGGRTYWLCSHLCAQRFDADPSRYALGIGHTNQELE